ncbi:MAG TPA: hypothetical protein VGM98_24740 [Schlesneria sp.]|jgi:hypothetical protein
MINGCRQASPNAPGPRRPVGEFLAIYNLVIAAMCHFQSLRCSALCVMLMGLWGCGDAAKIHPVDTDVARSALDEAMRAWVEGKKPKDLQPEMYATDQDWVAGKKLVSFKILDEEEVEGSNVNLRVNRKLSPADPSVDPTVKYIITTSPAITITPQQ